MSNQGSTKKQAKEIIFQETFSYNNLELTFQNIQFVLGENSDFSYRHILIKNKTNLQAYVIYIDGMINSQLVSDYIIKPMMEAPQFDCCETPIDAIKAIEEGTIYYSSTKKRTSIADILKDLLSGSAVVLFDSQKLAFSFETKGFDKRTVTEPSVENVIKGAKDAFVETIRSNTATCRRKIKSPNLVIEETLVGEQTETTIAICYMKNIAKETLVSEVKNRLNSVKVDNVLTTGYLEEFLVDSKASAFPQIQFTERPDRFCTNLLDGRVGIIIDGLPVAYIVPGTLLQYLQAPEDYSQHFLISSAIRYLRFTSMFITLLLPGFFVSIVNFHQEMIPTELTFSIIAAKEGVPFPMFVEVILMLAAFELLVEAGLRLPQTIGQTVSIVGALVVGQSAVEAKLLSPVTVIIVAITAITSFTMPNQDFSNALRLWRFGFVVISSAIGIYGLTMSLVVLLCQWCKIDSFGIPYLSPFVGDEEMQLKDTLFRFPLSSIKYRPSSLRTRNKHRVE